ncbi:TetR/AcrR family transcriptional regulator [Chondromyces apiculatus]|uniref:Transcriptional regulator, TetR family n=1 Tax=Chondromyces apiculatus DSM 436 TaxID=1192034 RepID=A0A017SYD9_9BACT|nr:TetR/AcrR family transcriptional regulator [Chondromyces apiculatus]EYF01792.1 transcriptional regulator, TetR family [Chondromyces apiculatus DSM 436]
MTRAYERKKEPALVRRRLLEHGARLCGQQGVAGLSLQEVAETAGVTKGGLLHHFPSKQALVEAIFDDLMQAFEEIVQREMASDPEPFGRFTRAYINGTLDLIGREDRGGWSALMMSTLTEPSLKRKWVEWLDGHLQQEGRVDADPMLELARYAVDGMWLSGFFDAHDLHGSPAETLRRQLITLTRKP